MAAEKLANRYAKAIFVEALESEKLDDVSKDMEYLNTVIESSRELKLFLRSPIITQEKKVNVINALFADKITPLSCKLLEVLIDNGREGFASEIANAFLKMYNKHMNITHVYVTTAIEMDADKKQLVEKAILKKFGESKLVLHEKVDKELIGGFIVDLEDKVYDASVRNKLSNIANEIVFN